MSVPPTAESSSVMLSAAPASPLTTRGLAMLPRPVAEKVSSLPPRLKVSVAAPSVLFGDGVGDGVGDDGLGRGGAGNGVGVAAGGAVIGDREIAEVLSRDRSAAGNGRIQRRSRWSRCIPRNCFGDGIGFRWAASVKL